MGKTYRIDLVDRDARKSKLGSVTTECIRCAIGTKASVSVEGALHFSPEDKQIYLKTASTHGDTMRLSISDDVNTFLGDFCLHSFDPQSSHAVFRALGDIKVLETRN